MRIAVPVKTVPDLAEEIELTADRTAIDREYLKFAISEWDAQALEEALLIKDAAAAEVVAVGLASDPDIRAELYTAIAKGADAAVLLTAAGAAGDRPPLVAERAALIAAYLAAEPAELVLTGVQAADDFDGQLPPALAARLRLPHASVAVTVEPAEPGAVTVRQELGGGRVHELLVRLPAVIGVQAARQAPRYAPVSRVRQAQTAGALREVTVTPAAPAGPAPVLRQLRLPEHAGQASMLAGTPDEVAAAIAALLAEAGLVNGASR